MIVVIIIVIIIVVIILIVIIAVIVIIVIIIVITIICMHECIRTYLHTHIPTHVYIYIHTYTYIPTYLHTYLPAYIPTYLHAYIHTYLFADSAQIFQVDMSPSVGITQPSSHRSKDLHDIQFMLCELQKFLHQGQSLRDYAGPQCSWALASTWLFLTSVYPLNQVVYHHGPH